MRKMTPLEIIAACDVGPDAMVSAGLPKPKTLGDVVRVMWAAQDQLTETDRRRLAVRDRMELDYVASATKVPGAYPGGTLLPLPK